MKFFNRKQTLLLLTAVTVIGSVITFYATNLILSDISNMFYMTVTEDFITSIPMCAIAIQFVSGFICLLDLYLDPDYGRRTIVACMDVIVFTSLIGFGATIVSYFVIYSRFMVPYPFAGAGIIFIVYYVLCFVGSSFLNVWGQGLPKVDKKKRKFGEILFRFFRTLFLFFAFNRFGAFLFSPVYIQWRSFGLTFPFFLSLLLPVSLIALMVYMCVDTEGKGSKIRLIASAVIFVLDIVLYVYIFRTGSSNTLFPAAISPAMPIDRLLTMPVEAIVHGGVATVLSIYALIASLVRYKHDKRGN